MSETQYIVATSDKSKKTATILCCLGFIALGGIHDFYVGKIGSGLFKLFTANFVLIGTIVDLIKLASGTYLDGAGTPLKR